MNQALSDLHKISHLLSHPPGTPEIICKSRQMAGGYKVSVLRTWIYAPRFPIAKHWRRVAHSLHFHSNPHQSVGAHPLRSALLTRRTKNDTIPDYARDHHAR